MAIIGEIIKRAIGVTGIISSDPEPMGSSTQLRQNNGFLEGEISGISASNIPL